jgi:probable F420-dependent oxidoreductase
MKIGVSTIITDHSIDVAALARRAEELGFDSLWLGEHPIIPVSSTSRYPGSSDGTLPEAANRMADPFVALARASAVTKVIKLGTGVCLIPEHNPLSLAKVIASLDHFSSGRFVFGIGAGWNQEETEIMGGNFVHRWSQTHDAIQAMKELWTKEEAEYHGKYYDFPPVKSFPKPFQKPHPPILLGGTARNVFKRTVEWGDGWMPSASSPKQIKQGRDTLNELAAQSGRDPRSIQVVAYTAPADREALKAYEDAGADAAVVRVATASEKEVLAELEEVAGRVLA